MIANHAHLLALRLLWTDAAADGRQEIRFGDDIVCAAVVLVEDEVTDHWFFNRESEPVKVVVCDMVPPS